MSNVSVTSFNSYPVKVGASVIVHTEVFSHILETFKYVSKELNKNIYPECKFSVTFSTASMCSEIHVTLMESPYRLNKTFEELTNEELYDGHFSYNYQYGRETDDRQKEYFLKNCYTNEVQKIMKDVDRFVNSYRYDDSDGMIDYFDTNFYYFGCSAGKWNKSYVQNESRLAKKRKVLMEV